MAKDKEFEKTYKEDGLRRMKERKESRLANFRQKKLLEETKSGCRGCGEDPYCYCGSGTPGVIDY